MRTGEALRGSGDEKTYEGRVVDSHCHGGRVGHIPELANANLRIGGPMSSKEWAAVALVIGGGILLPILGHDAAEMDHSTMSMPAAEALGPMKTVALDVTGMT